MAFGEAVVAEAADLLEDGFGEAALVAVGDHALDAAGELPEPGEQQQRSRKDDEQVEETVAPESDLAARKEALDADIDAILEDIDEALETNAEEFVRGVVQKGGQ